MQRTSNSDEDHLYRSLRVVFLVLLLLGLAACGQSFGDACSDSQATILSACTSPTPPGHTHKMSHTHTEVIKLKPTPSPTPSPTPIVVTQKLISKSVTHYIDLVLEERYWEAYKLLSAEERAQEPFNDFKQNPNYTLSRGCWKIGDIMTSPLNSQSGIANVQLTQISCSDDRLIAYYDWVIRFQIEQNHLVIVSIDLYPAAPAN
jgi:hypothetical protein